ncbi:MmgE/PrpD family protein [Nonomuraea soli]|uniref:2-methylcitrate dehydratase PrpD n=1 Tax=Nonomuraea soli TaxID=1032476 RepID=A0A7W0HPC7_9ACTN|nr:MmgE/PrpD family protein [Nonomuraea soli]MBA2890738.1 2-methylcitrate dehydratase PrpD [Nonomuraea soli]
MTAAERLAGWALELSLEQVPEAAVEAALRHLLDGLGCAVAAGTDLPAITVARELGGPAEATILGTPWQVGAPAAALANGMLVHALDFDDTHAGGLVHATAPVLPAAFAVGEEIGASGAEVLAAALTGYETICRLGAAVPHGFHARGLHATATCGVFAAALAAARLYGLTHAETVDALGIAGSQAGGLLEFLNTGSSTKQLHPGFAAQAGVLAARLARAGASGPATVLEGPYGLYGALLGLPGLDPVTELGERWEVTRIGVKPYPACQLLHASLDAARGLTGDIEEIVAEVHPDTAPIVCGEGKDRPRTPYDAKFSLPWSVAAMIVDGEVTVRTYADVDRPEVAALAARIRHEVVPFPGVAAAQPGRLRIRFADGTSTVAQAPPGLAGVAEAVRAKALGNGLSERAIGLVLDLASLPTLQPLIQELIV